MAMTIRQKIQKVIDDMPKNPDLAERLREQAVEAIHDVEGSQAWQTFMENFAGQPVDPVHLARLTGVNDAPCNPPNAYHRSARAYLIANATCGTPTYTGYLLGVTDHFDVTLPASQPEETDPADE
jgi:hypothetical protein